MKQDIEIKFPEPYTLNIGDNHYEFFDEGNGDKTIFLIHGIAAGKEDTWYLFSEFKKKYRCIYVDLPGHGNIPLGSFNTISAVAEYLTNLIKYLGLKHVHLLGYSLGGIIATEIVNLPEAQELVDSAIIWGSPVLGFGKGVRKRTLLVYKLFQYLPSKVYEKIIESEKLRKLAKPFGVRPNIVEIKTSKRFSLASRIKYIRMLEKWRYDHNSSIRKLYVFGKNDPIVNNKNPAYIVSCHDNTCEVIHRKHVGHWGKRSAWSDVIKQVEEFVG